MNDTQRISVAMLKSRGALSQWPGAGWDVAVMAMTLLVKRGWCTADEVVNAIESTTETYPQEAE